MDWQALAMHAVTALLGACVTWPLASLRASLKEQRRMEELVITLNERIRALESSVERLESYFDAIVKRGLMPQYNPENATWKR